MTRDEAKRHCGALLSIIHANRMNDAAKANEMVDHLVALGLKIDEPTPKEIAYVALKQAGHNAALIMDELECLGLGIVKVGHPKDTEPFNIKISQEGQHSGAPR